jgi:hypothetical protein
MHCPINIECPVNKCPNHVQCYDASLAWELPFYFTTDGLFVKPSYRTRWQKQAYNSMVGNLSYCPLPSGDYMPICDGGGHEYLVRMRIEESLIEAGWAAAVPLPNQIIDAVDNNIDNVF